MQYAISFLEGIITFISPCLLPMLPVYISYFAGGVSENDTKKAVKGALGFILGFTLVFITLGAFAGFLGGLLRRYQTVVNIVTGAIVLVFGLNYIGIIKIRMLNNNRSNARKMTRGFLPAVLFGIVFSIGWTPCVGAFLGSALILASQRGSVVQGILMLLFYSLGLGVPFVLSALMIEKLKTSFSLIKKYYKAVNTVSGLFLVFIGILMIT